MYELKLAPTSDQFYRSDICMCMFSYVGVFNLSLNLVLCSTRVVIVWVIWEMHILSAKYYNTHRHTTKYMYSCILRGNSWSNVLRILIVDGGSTEQSQNERERHLTDGEKISPRWINNKLNKHNNNKSWLNSNEILLTHIQILNLVCENKAEKLNCKKSTWKISTKKFQLSKIIVTVIIRAKVQIKMKQVANSVTNAGWNTFWWILGTICMPITTPYIVSKVISLLKFRKNRDSLTGKVSSIEKVISHWFWFFQDSKLKSLSRKSLIVTQMVYVKSTTF